MRIILTAVLLCVNFASIFSQDNPKIASLHNKLIMEKEDTIRIRLLNELSVQHSYGDKEKALQNGINDYLTKPCNEEALLMAIVKWLKI